MSEKCLELCLNQVQYRTVDVDHRLRFNQDKMETNSPGGTELSEMKIVTSSPVSVSTSNPNHSEQLQCRNGVCKISRRRNNPQTENPWHYLKTVFLISVIIALIIWIIVYTLLVQYKVL